MCHLHPLISFMTQPINRSLFGFEAQTMKLSEWFWGPNHQTVAADFKAQIGKPEAIGFEVKPGETIDLGFEAQPRNPRSSSPCTRCRPHAASPNLSIVRPPSAWPVSDHPRSSAWGLLLLPWSSSLPAMSHLSPAHHEISKHDSPHKIDKGRTTETSEFKFKLRQVNYSSQSNQGTDHLVSQSPIWWVHWQ
jgi:hypothetical protein